MLFRGQTLDQLSDEDLQDAADYAEEHMIRAQQLYALNRAFLEEVGIEAQRRLDRRSAMVN